MSQQIHFCWNFIHSIVDWRCITAPHSSSFCPPCSSLFSSDSRLTSGSQHPSDDHYKVGGHDLHTPIATPLPLPAVTLCCIHTPHFLSHWKKQPSSASKCFPRHKLMDWDIKRSRLTAGNSHRKWRCAATLWVPLQDIYLDEILFFPFFLHGNPHPSITPGVPQSMSGSWRSKPAVSCSLLRLQGGIASLPLVPRHITPPPPNKNSCGESN